MQVDRAQMQRSASVEAEVARARLARATQQGDRGDVLGAVDQAAEVAFDAGLVYGYALLAGDQEFQSEAQRLLEASKDRLRAWVILPERASANPPRSAAKRLQNAQEALQVGACVEAIYLAGAAYAESPSGEAALVYVEGWKCLRSSCFAPNPSNVRKLTNQLLR